VVLLLYLSGVPGPVSAKFRALDTILGGALALTIYRIWPTWESRQLREVLAQELEAIGRDSELLLGTYVDPRRWDPGALQQSRAAARLARSNAEASVERALGEPTAGDRFDPQLALSLLAHFDATRSARSRCTQDSTSDPQARGRSSLLSAIRSSRASRRWRRPCAAAARQPLCRR
jgi:uncharacterized membrane protein YccC